VSPGVAGPSAVVVAGLILLAASCGAGAVAPPRTDPPVVATPSIATTTTSPPATTTTSPPATAREMTGPDTEVLDRVWRSVARVKGLGCTASQVGTGFVVAPGLIVTAAHVVAGLSAPEVDLGGEMQTATVVAFDTVADLALLAADTAVAQALAPAEAVAGQPVVVPAFDEDGVPETITARIIRRIRAVGKDIYGEPGDGRDAFEVEASVGPGNSGAPLVDGYGNSVGVLFSRTRGGPQVAYAVQASEIGPLLDAAARGGGTPVDSGECRPR